MLAQVYIHMIELHCIHVSYMLKRARIPHGLREFEANRRYPTDDTVMPRFNRCQAILVADAFHTYTLSA